MSISSGRPRPAARAGSPGPLRAAAGNGLLDAAAWKELGRRLGLSPRELQIARRLFAGDKESAIATALGLSAHTVHTHVERLYDKFDVDNRAALLVRLFAAFLALVASPGSPLPPLCPHYSAGRCPLRRTRSTASPGVGCLADYHESPARV